MNETPMTPEQLAEIRDRAEAATPGPWGAYEFGGGLVEIAADLKETGCGYTARRGIARFEEEPLDNDPAHREWTAEEDWDQVQADAEFTAHARQDVPALAAEVARLRADNAEWEAARDAYYASEQHLTREVERLRAELDTLRALVADATEYRVLLPDLGGKELRVRRQGPGFGAGWAVSEPQYGGGRAWTREGWQEVISALSVDRLFCWPDAPTAIREGRAALAEAGERS
ncbi:hypothetical protein OHB04_02650 [Streptomyces sp. NBC_01775]|uniref:hypothetical protein n=1 Tax=Streptomyces sp. NBC_01775 TaxID=2975939 RepID=UPI002DDBABD8|nr:hypothetical protein [Streptomyces sp. NBC_01775]WSB74793.1 hypothetical protein OHB04_02650 [Streptomyces sp. NBC_01775]